MLYNRSIRVRIIVILILVAVGLFCHLAGYAQPLEKPGPEFMVRGAATDRYGTVDYYTIVKIYHVKTGRCWISYLDRPLIEVTKEVCQ